MVSYNIQILLKDVSFTVGSMPLERSERYLTHAGGLYAREMHEPGETTGTFV